MSGFLGRLYRGETRIDFIGRRKLWFAISGTIVAVCIVSLATNGLNYGIEFEGGVSITAPIEDPGLADASVTEIESTLRGELGPLGAGEAQIQITSDESGRSVLVQTKEIADPDVQQDVVSAVAETVGTTIEKTDSQRVGSKWGGEITRKALRALVIFLVVLAVFLTWRFEWKMALAAMIALVHDLTITAGVYSFVGFEVTPSTVIAILTILGYSLYDTVVVFDKVEEDTTLLAASGRMTYEAAANQAMNEVFMRSLNTSLATLLPVATLLFVGTSLLGAETLKDLALALFVGLMVGAYSSIYVATPILTMLKEREPKFRNVREKVLRDARRAEPAVAGAGDVEAAVTTTSPGPTQARPARAGAGSKKARRRRRR
ncbi:MAG: protein translocase subunit SecF [Actinomycetota bacterium]